MGLRTATWETLSPVVLRQFLGGSGLGAYLMLREDQARVDPLSPESCLAFVFSPLVGSPLTTSAKFAVVCKSPLTHRFNDSLVSSAFAIAGKRVGADAIVIAGQADSPSLLVIDNDQICLRDARELWGETVPVTITQLEQQLGPGFETAVIGPAGENGVRYATISHDGRHAGRGGSGAVMGAKHLKGIAVRGRTRCSWASPATLVDYAKSLSDRSMGEATAKYRELGTASNLLAFNRLNALPTRNFQTGSFEGADRISVETLVQSRQRARASCAACTIGCEHLYSISSANHDATTPVRLEYENLFALGSLCGIDDPDTVLRASRRCDELGMDTISAGGTIALAMECAQRGWLDASNLKFGDGTALLEMLELIGHGRGLGNIMGQGSRKLAQSIGPHAEQIAAHVKGLEIPGYEPRAAQSMALGFAVGTRGADHNRSGAYEADFSGRADRKKISERSVEFAIDAENRAALIDSLILCKFLRGVFDDLFAEAAEMLTMVCGWDIDAAEVRTICERIVNARKLFNSLAGWQPAEDTLPERFFSNPLPDDPEAVLTRRDLQRAIRLYNQKRHWHDTGELTRHETDRLGLSSWVLPPPQ